MNDNIAIVRAFIQAWERLDPVELASYFHEAGCYHNIPAKPVTGRAAVQQFITGFIKTWTKTDWEILTLIGEGEVVVCNVGLAAGLQNIDRRCMRPLSR